MILKVGEQIKFYRKQKGYTQKKLGQLCGMADSAIRRYEAGRANPKIETLAKIANALDLTIEDFLDISYIGNSKRLNESYEKSNNLENMNLLLEKNLLSHFNKLNNDGKEKAVEQVEILTKINEYTIDKP